MRVGPGNDTPCTPYDKFVPYSGAPGPFMDPPAPEIALRTSEIGHDSTVAGCPVVGAD